MAQGVDERLANQRVLESVTIGTTGDRPHHPRGDRRFERSEQRNSLAGRSPAHGGERELIAGDRPDSEQSRALVVELIETPNDRFAQSSTAPLAPAASLAAGPGQLHGVEGQAPRCAATISSTTAPRPVRRSRPGSAGNRRPRGPRTTRRSRRQRAGPAADGDLGPRRRAREAQRSTASRSRPGSRRLATTSTRLCSSRAARNFNNSIDEASAHCRSSSTITNGPVSAECGQHAGHHLVERELRV